GLYPGGFFPKETGRNYELPKLLKPLAGIREDMTVFSHLDHPGVKGGHEAVHTFLSGIMADGSKAMPERNVTMDQKAAEFSGVALRIDADRNRRRRAFVDSQWSGDPSDNAYADDVRCPVFGDFGIETSASVGIV
ncbi:MAG: DUF1552 domain-containing protein, partial [Verrucomicrobiia bacterium]